jgi:hypothetical protein
VLPVPPITDVPLWTIQPVTGMVAALTAEAHAKIPNAIHAVLIKLQFIFIFIRQCSH